MKPRIHTIIPADGWWALNPENGEATRLVCFALVDDELHPERRRIVGLDAIGIDDYGDWPEHCGQDEYVYLGNEPSAEAIQREVERIRNEKAAAEEYVRLEQVLRRRTQE